LNRERGGAAIALAGVAGVLATILVAVASLSTLYAARSQATVAADAAALAAASASFEGTGQGSPLAAARSVAQLNGARMLLCRCASDQSMRQRTVEVVVAIDVAVPLFGAHSVKATARAEFDPRVWLGR